MKYYLIPFILYLVVALAIAYFFDNTFIAYTLAMIVTGVLLILFWDKYKLKFKFDVWVVTFGVLIFLSWILLQGRYPLLFETSSFVPTNLIQWAVRLFGFVIITPLIEELFTRGFLIRYLVKQDWKKVRVGKFTWLSFIVTVLFFGLSHGEWLQGLVAGVLLNLLYYRSRSVGSCVLAHGIANLLLLLF